MSSTGILLSNRPMEDWRRLRLMNERLDTVLPLMKSYSLPKLEEVLEVHYFLGSAGPLGSGQGVTKPAKDFSPQFSNDNYSFDTRGIFMFAGMRPGIGDTAIIQYWGLTMKGDWLFIEVNQGYQGTTPHAHAIIVDVQEVDLVHVEESKGAEAICNLLDEAVQYWQTRHARLFEVIGEFDQQRALLRALKA